MAVILEKPTIAEMNRLRLNDLWGVYTYVDGSQLRFAPDSSEQGFVFRKKGVYKITGRTRNTAGAEDTERRAVLNIDAANWRITNFASLEHIED